MKGVRTAMTRTIAIAKIHATLPALADEQVDALAEMVEAWAQPHAPLELKPEELAGIERSKDDFKHGRTLTDDDYQAEMDAFMKRLAAKQSTVT
jgi:hypothetical protein